MDDFDIDTDSSTIEKNKLKEFCNLFHLTNMIHGNTCCMKNHKSTTDLILTNRSLSFQNTSTTETDLTIIISVFEIFFKCHYIRLKPKVVNYRNYKNFNQSTFLKEIESTDFLIDSNGLNEQYSHLTETFLKVVNKYAPLIKKVVRENQAPCVNKEMRKAIYTRTRLRNNF